jgi:hypothetical protein
MNAGRFLELLGLASDIRVEVPVTLAPSRHGEGPTGFPAVAWTFSATFWAVVLGVAYQLHARSADAGKGARVTGVGELGGAAKRR